jgi:hypothetical protein
MFDTPLPDCQIDPEPQTRRGADLIDLPVLWLEGREPAHRDMPGRGEHMRAVSRVLTLILTKLTIGGTGRSLRDQTRAQTAKCIGKRHGRLEDAQSQIPGAHHSDAVPLGNPVAFSFGLREQAIGTDKSRHRVPGVGHVR